MPEKLEFKVSSGLKDIIGRDLITDDFIAVFELVKNSYDANAKNVFIEFENNKIIISDQTTLNFVKTLCKMKHIVFAIC